MNADLLDGLVWPEEVLEREDAVDGNVGHPVQGRVRVDPQSAALLDGDDALDGVDLERRDVIVRLGRLHGLA